MIKKISQKWVDENAVSALSDRPNRPSRYGAGGKTPKEMKEWYDKLPRAAIEKINELIDAIGGDEKKVSTLLDLLRTAIPDEDDGEKKQTLAAWILATHGILTSLDTLFKGLSDLSDDDNGKIPRVVDGAWQKVDGNYFAEAEENARRCASEAADSAEAANAAKESLEGSIASLNDKLDKVDWKDSGEAGHLYKKVYAIDHEGNQTTLLASSTTSGAGEGTIPLRAVDSSITVSEFPPDAQSATSKKYVDNLFNGANKAVSYDSYGAMVTALNSANASKYRVGQNIMIVTLNVPDLWVSSVNETAAAYTYTSDSAIVEALEMYGSITVGYYVLSALETQKVDLTDYALKESVATKLESSTPTEGVRFYYATPEGQSTYDMTRDGALTISNGKVFRHEIATNEPKSYTLVQRTAGGVIYTGEPTENRHATTKKYVDGVIETLTAYIDEKIEGLKSNTGDTVSGGINLLHTCTNNNNPDGDGVVCTYEDISLGKFVIVSLDAVIESDYGTIEPVIYTWLVSCEILNSINEPYWYTGTTQCSKFTQNDGTIECAYATCIIDREDDGVRFSIPMEFEGNISCTSSKITVEVYG